MSGPCCKKRITGAFGAMLRAEEYRYVRPLLQEENYRHVRRLLQKEDYRRVRINDRHNTGGREVIL